MLRVGPIEPLGGIVRGGSVLVRVCGFRSFPTLRFGVITTAFTGFALALRPFVQSPAEGMASDLPDAWCAVADGRLHHILNNCIKNFRQPIGYYPTFP